VKIPETNEFMAEFYGRANINFSQTIPKNWKEQKTSRLGLQGQVYPDARLYKGIINNQ
jgi:hypothetical protein